MGAPDTLTRVSRLWRIRHCQAAHGRSAAVGAHDEIVRTAAAVAESYIDLLGAVLNSLDRRTVPDDGAHRFGGVQQDAEQVVPRDACSSGKFAPGHAGHGDFGQHLPVCGAESGRVEPDAYVDAALS